jgi:hypothetical protein
VQRPNGQFNDRFHIYGYRTFRGKREAEERQIKTKFKRGWRSLEPLPMSYADKVTKGYPGWDTKYTHDLEKVRALLGLNLTKENSKQ